MILVAATLPAQTAPAGFPQDWSHHHLVFSNPGTYQEAVHNGTLAKWLKIASDPRYIIQQRARARAAAASPDEASSDIKKPVKLKKDWTTSLGGLAATLTGTVGTLNSSSISGSSTLTVDSVVLDASAPTAASATGTFSGYPTGASTPTITVNSGAGAITLANNGSPQTETVQFTGPPLSNTSLTIPTTSSATNNLVLTTSGTGRVMVGSVGGTAPAANTTISVTAGVSGSTTTTLTNAGTGASDQGTFSGPGYNTTAGQITVNNGTSTFTFSPGGTGASVVGTFSNNLPWTGTMHIIINGGNNLVLTPSSGTLATGGAVVVNTSSTTPGAGTITLGNINYVVSTSGTVSTPGSGTCNVTFTGTGSSGRNSFRTNLAAAISSPGSGGSTTTYLCTSATNTYISSATNNGTSQVSLTLSSNYPGLAGQTAVNATFADGSTNTSITSFSGSVNGTSGCTSSTVGTIATAPTSSTQASNMISAVTSCLASFPAVGVTATANGSTAVNIISVTPGASDQGFSLAVTGTSATNFGFGTPANGADAGSNTCSGTTGTYINSTTTTTVAPNLAAAMGACSSPGFTASAPSSTVTVTSTAIGSTATLTVNASNPTNFAWTTKPTVSGSNGTSTCTGSSGTFAYSATAATLAGNIASALNSNSGACANALGVTAVQGNGSNGGSTTQVVVTETTPGTFTTLSGGGTVSTSAFSWAAASAGTQGSNTCSGTTGTFATGTAAADTITMASNLAAAINACSPTYASTVLASANNNSSSTVTITASINGTFVLTTPTGSNASMLTIGSPTTGSNGTNTCTGSGPWTANFATSGTLSTIAADVTSAITACTLGSKGVTATGNAVVSTTALGTGATLTVGATNNAGIFGWSSVTAGTDGTNSSTTFAYWSVNNYLTSAQVATNIANAVNANTTLQGSTGVSAAANTPASGNVIFTAQVVGTAANIYTVTPSAFSAFTGGTLSGGTASPTGGKVQPNAYPAKFSFGTTAADCSGDFVVYPTGALGATGVATIVAYNNLYTGGCTGAIPSIYWTYNTGTGDAVTTSPIISFDSTGSQVAFIQSSSTTASLVLLKWAANTSGTLTSQTASNYRSCTAPCMYTLTFSGSHNDTLSAPFYDYHGDTLYVGDDSGNLHQFTGVFNGTPAENTTSPWPVNLGANKLASPVYDPTWSGGQVFVGDLGGALHCVTPSTGAIFGTKTGLGEIADAPLIDSSANYVLAFDDSDAVTGFSEQFFPGGQGGPVGVGTGGTGYYLYAGTFDNVYYQSSTRTGSIYVVGNTGATTGAALYQVGLSGGFLTGSAPAVVSGLTPSGNNPWPSPVTEFCNPGSNSACALNVGGTATTTGTDYVFFSVNRGNKGGCTNSAGNGCILSYNVSTPTAVAISGTGLNVTTPGTNGCWATGGLVIDNGSTSAGASQVYFANLTGNNAGGPTGATSSHCTTGSSATMAGVQASQSSP